MNIIFIGLWSMKYFAVHMQKQQPRAVHVPPCFLLSLFQGGTTVQIMLSAPTPSSSPPDVYISKLLLQTVTWYSWWPRVFKAPGHINLLTVKAPGHLLRNGTPALLLPTDATFALWLMVALEHDSDALFLGCPEPLRH